MTRSSTLTDPDGMVIMLVPRATEAAVMELVERHIAPWRGVRVTDVSAWPREVSSFLEGRFHTLGQVADLTERELLDVAGIGPKGVDAVKAVIRMALRGERIDGLRQPTIEEIVTAHG